MISFKTIFLATAAAACYYVEASNTTVRIPVELTYLLPPALNSSLDGGFINADTNNTEDNDLLHSAINAPFIVYDSEFATLIGTNPSLHLVAERPVAFTGEAGVWVPNRNEVWFTSNTNDDPTSLEVLNVLTNTIYTPNTSIPIVNPNGGYYFDGKVYIAGLGTFTQAPCIYAIDPNNGNTTVVLNNYFGLKFNGPNDITWVKKGDKAYMFFTDDPTSEEFAPGANPAQLPDAVWRFDPEDQSLVPVISRADILIPNGIRVNAKQTKLYVTDTTPTTPGIPSLAGGASGWGSPAIYVFDLDEEAFPINKRMIGISRTGISDGIHIDDAGRIWTAEYEGVVVRSPLGKVLGLFNSQAYSVNVSTHVANFALAGDTLVIEDVERLWTVKLNETVVTQGRFEL